MKNMILISALAAASIPTIAQAAPANIVIVDTDRVYAECTACRSAQSQLQTQATALQARQTALATPLKTDGQALQNSIKALNGKAPDAALQARVTAFQARENSANQELARMQQTLQSTQANVLRQINARLGPVINQVMVAKGANLAVDVNGTLAHGNALDVTTDVITALNTALPSVSVTPGTAPATQGR